MVIARENEGKTRITINTLRAEECQKWQRYSSLLTHRRPAAEFTI
jgi:hypothetical protein